VCVGNSQPEVQAWARQARGSGAEVFSASPAAEAAAGVLEGLRALGFVG
jgi:hypothetical protein